MHKKPTIHDVAKKAGVSSSTVSRVLNNRGYISEITRSKVWASIEELQYTPNELARSLYKKRTNTVGLIFPTVMQPYFAEIIFYLENELAKKNYRVLLCSSASDIETERKHLQMLGERQVDGAIVEIDTPFEYLSGVPYPIVSIGKQIDESLPAVFTDYVSGGEMAATELIRSSASNLACILDHTRHPFHTEKLIEGYTEVIRQQQLKNVVFELKPKSSAEDRKKQILTFFKENPEVDGLFVTNDETALLIFQLASQLEKKIPDELKVVGYGGTKLMESLCDDLTTIKEPIEKLACCAVDILLKSIQTNRVVPKTTVVPVQLQSKLSTSSR